MTIPIPYRLLYFLSRVYVFFKRMNAGTVYSYNSVRYGNTELHRQGTIVIRGLSAFVDNQLPKYYRIERYKGQVCEIIINGKRYRIADRGEFVRGTESDWMPLLPNNS